MRDACSECGRKRSAGWLLVEGFCMECRPDVFEARRNFLRKQLQELAMASAGGSEAA